MAAPAAKRRTAAQRREANRERLVAAIEEVISAMADVDTAYDPKDAVDQLALAGLLQDLVNGARDALSIVGAAVVDTIPSRYEPQQVPGGGIFKTAGGKERKAYDAPRIIAAAAKALNEQDGIVRIVTTTGETKDADIHLAGYLNRFAALAGCGTPSYTGWRSTAAKKLGLDLDKFCEVTTSAVTTRIEGRGRTT
jgi:hypothetical protein